MSRLAHSRALMTAGAGAGAGTGAGWAGPADSLAFGPEAIRRQLAELQAPCFLVTRDGRLGATSEGEVTSAPDGAASLVAALAPLPAEQLGNPDFRHEHAVKLAYAAGSMANGVAGEELVIALGREGILSGFGAAGLAPQRVEQAIGRLGEALPAGPFALNMIHSPDAPGLEHALAELYLRRGVRTVEASAFMELTPAIVRFRVKGIELGRGDSPIAGNRVIAKVSRREVAEQFLRPPPTAILRELVAAQLVEEWQARAAAELPVADDVTIEADSGGHTDGQPLVCVLPAMIALRDALQAEYGYRRPPRIGAAGGIATPAAVAAALTLGADYVVTGSINQSCVEAATSATVKALLAQAQMSDVAMAPAADMFELGVQVQVLKRGTLFAMRARRLYELYRAHESLEAIAPAERLRLERELFRLTLDEVWEQTRAFLAQRDPQLLERAEADARQRMAMVFRWYLGRSSEWAATGDPERVPDYQVWCGPAMGAFNDWAAGSYLGDPAQRRAGDVAWNLMSGAAYLMRVQAARAQGAAIPAQAAAVRPSRRRHLGPMEPPLAPSPATPAVAPAPADAATAEDIERWLVAELAARLGIDGELVDVQTEFAAYALSSPQALAILARLEERLGRRLSQTLVWNYPTIQALAAHLGRE